MEGLAVELFETEDKEVILDGLMKKHGQDLLRLVHSYVNNRQLAEDLTQDIFVKCYKSLHTYKGKSEVKTWLWRIAINHCKDYLKSWYNKNVIISENEKMTAIAQKGSVEQTVKKDEDETIASAVMNLPIKYREVIYLYYFEELSIKEIALLTTVKENTIKTRLRKAKELVKAELEDYSNGE